MVASIGLPLLCLICGGCASDKVNHYSLGVENYTRGRLPEAIHAYKEAISLNPEDPRPRFNLAVTYQDQGRSDEAVRLYQSILQRNPNHAPTLANLASIQEGRGDPEGAERFYGQAREVDKDKCFPSSQYGFFLLRRDRTQDAEVAFKEATPIKGKAGSIPVTVQAALDDSKLYLRFQWKQPPASGGAKMDKDNPVKLAVILQDNKVEMANLAGCWATCHQDVRTMPNVKDDNKTKYVTGGSLASGKYYDLIQFRSGKGAKPMDGYVADKRVMEGGKALVSAEGKQTGDTWTVVFTRKLAGGEGDIALQPGEVYNFGFASAC